MKIFLDQYKIGFVEKIYEVGNHHEYEGRPLPAFVISYEGAEEFKIICFCIRWAVPNSKT